MIFLRRPSPQSRVLPGPCDVTVGRFCTYINFPQSLIPVLCLSASFFMLPKFSLYPGHVYVRESYIIGNRILSRLYLHNCQRAAGGPSTVNLLLHSHLWLHIELPYFMLFTQLSLLLIMKISNRSKHEWTLHGQNNLWIIIILVIGHWHKNLAQDMKAWGFTNASFFLDLPICQRGSAERAWSSLQTPSPSFLCIMEDPCYRLNIKYTITVSVIGVHGAFILEKNKSSQ